MRGLVLRACLAGLALDGVTGGWLQRIERLSLPPEDLASVLATLVGDSAAAVRVEALVLLRDLGSSTSAFEAVRGALADRDADPSVGLAAVDALVALATRSPWIAVAERKPVDALGVACDDHARRPVKLDSLIDRPTVLTFFDTRCTNPYKCAATVKAMSALDGDVAKAGLAGRVRLLRASYEPHYDTPNQLAAFAKTLGIALGDDTRMLRIDPNGLPSLLAALDIPVSFKDREVGVHGVLALVFDGKGRLARRYTTVIWNNANVIEDLKQLEDEAR